MNALLIAASFANVLFVSVNHQTVKESTDRMPTSCQHLISMV